ncbi:MAG: DUF3540 domain-containing protein [Polyangiaceae bacterium]|nr:DUF3540 domain-containing protein [Polyangiaceae bacterium]
MEAVARKHEPKLVYEEFAEVVSAGEVLTLKTNTGKVVARRAASCLLVPEVGDRVLCVIETRGDAFVLAVLERADGAQRATVELPEKTLLRAAERLTIAANQGVDVVGGGEVRISSARVEVTAMHTRLAGRVLDVVGEVVGADLGRVKLVAKTVDGMLERLSQRVKRSFKVVEETDQVKARHLDYAAETVAHFRGEHTVVTAKDLVKVNGEQIHVG